MRRYSWAGLLLLMLALPVFAQGAGGVRKQVEASMRVTGEITVDEQGQVASYTLDDPAKLPSGIVKFVRDNIAHWKFEPPVIEGKSVSIRNNLSVLLVANRQEDGDYLMRVQAVSFYPQQTDAGYEVASRVMTPPRYPMSAARAGVGGVVFLALKVGRDGQVQDVAAEQVNLKAVASENQMNKFRQMLATASIDTARRWSFDPPARGELAAADYWTVRVPVEFSLGDALPRYGEWVKYVPGPRIMPSWVEEMQARESPEAMAAGTPRIVGGDGLRLLTPLAQEG